MPLRRHTVETSRWDASAITPDYMTQHNNSTGRLFLDLYTYMAWADARMWEAVVATPEAVNDEPIRTLIAHLHTTQQAFLKSWRGDEFKYIDPSSFTTFQEVYTYAKPFYAEVLSFLATKSDADFDRTLNLPWARFFSRQMGSEAADTTLGETILQLSHHTSHHRGQVNMQVRLLGGTPFLVDYIGWLWMGRPEPAWDKVEEASSSVQ